MTHVCVIIKNNDCLIECENHYSGYGRVFTKLGKIIYIKGAPRLYKRGSLFGVAQDEVIQENDNKKSAPFVQELLKEPDINKWGDYLTGNFILIVVDKKELVCHIITDLGNSFHIYQSRFSDSIGMAFSTDIDDLALKTGKKNDIDYVSLTEYLINNNITYPYTGYVKIKEIAYASCLRCDYSKDIVEVDEFHYWFPTCHTNESSSNIKELSIELRSGLLSTGEDVLVDKKNIGLFLSGGIDSRVLAGLMSYLGINGRAITVADIENIETKIAHKVAKINGFEHEVFLRDFEYYPRLIEGHIALEGPHSTFTRATHLGFCDRIKSCGFDALLGGYMSDTLLKLHEANVMPKTFLGRNMGPLEKFDPTDFKYLRGGDEYIEQFSFLFNQDILKEIKKRREKIMEYWNNIRSDGSAWEWSWMWPFTRNQHNANLTTNIFNYPSFEIFTERFVIEIARVASQKIKINGLLFNKAMWPFLKKSASIPNAVTRLPLFYPPWLNECAITMKHILPRRWAFKESSKIQSSNLIATHRSYPNLAKLWDVSRLLHRLRLEYNAFDIEKAIMLPRKGGSVFDTELYQGLAKEHRQHIMYTMLHLDRWNKHRIAL